MSYRLELRGITKQYPGVRANDAVSLKVRPGEIHAVLGENGAGKSTLMKIIYGSVKPDEGSVFFNGQAVQVRNPQEARALGIAMVFQHFSLFDTLTVAENVWLGLDKSLTLAEVTGRISAKVKPNVVVPPGVSGNPEAVVAISLLPDGSVVGEPRLRQSTGNAALDAAILRADREGDGIVRPQAKPGFAAHHEAISLEIEVIFVG